MQTIRIQYRFRLEEGKEEIFELQLDPKNLQTIVPKNNTAPQWADLAFHQCPNCPLDLASASYCPAAVNMIGLVNRLKQLLSYDRTLVVVITEERTVYSRTTVQRGICSLMGLLMATSACPLMAFFKTMARFHLPFASIEETIWRATSSYLLAQYFRHQDGLSADIAFAGLSNIYTEIQKVNTAFVERLRAVCHNDSMMNAIILLDLFAKFMPSAIDESLEEIRPLFAPYLSHAF